MTTEPENIVELADSAHGQSRAGSVETAESVHKQLLVEESEAYTRKFKDIFLLQKNAATIFQKLHNRFGYDETREFWSRVAGDEQARRQYTKAKVAFDLEILDSAHDKSPAQSSTESDDEEGTLCERCGRKRKRKPDKLQRLDERFRSFDKYAAKHVKALIKNHWVDLEGKSTHIVNSRSLVGESKDIVCLSHHLVLRQMAKDNDLRWLRRALALMRNLQSYEDFLSESGYTTEEQRNSHRARDEYIRYIYQSQILNKKEERQARAALNEQLRYGRRWKICVSVLTAGFLLVCGRELANNVM